MDFKSFSKDKCPSMKCTVDGDRVNWLKLKWIHLVGWLVGLGFNCPLRQYFSLYRAVIQREGERGKTG